MRMPKSVGLFLLLVLASSPALAKQTQSADQQPVSGIKAKSTNATAAPGSNRKRGVAGKPGKAAGRSERRHAKTEQHDVAAFSSAEHLGPVRVVGEREVGRAAWYGGRHLGHRMANGEPLDAVRPTAAHRSLPLHSHVRVTNLNNGRSVIAKITDRGPVSNRLLIDVSPRAADLLDMKRSGIAEVSIERVVPITYSGTTLPQQ